jgi:hypothetical protein
VPCLMGRLPAASIALHECVPAVPAGSIVGSAGADPACLFSPHAHRGLQGGLAEYTYGPGRSDSPGLPVTSADERAADGPRGDAGDARDGPAGPVDESPPRHEDHRPRPAAASSRSKNKVTRMVPARQRDIAVDRVLD